MAALALFLLGVGGRWLRFDGCEPQTSLLVGRYVDGASGAVVWRVVVGYT